MAYWFIYKCGRCGYEAWTEPDGYYQLDDGWYYNFLCPSCRQIVAISEWELKFRPTYSPFHFGADPSFIDDSVSPKCPECGNDKGLTPWRPLDGCPKCGSSMEQMPGGIDAD